MSLFVYRDTEIEVTESFAINKNIFNNTLPSGFES